MKAKLTKTQKTFRKWKTAKVFSRIGTFGSPFIPATVITIINAPEWFNKNGVTIGVGLVSLILSLVITIVVFLKKDKMLKDKAHYLFPLSVILLCFGVSFMFLASVSHEFGKMFVWTALGVCVGGISGQLEKNLISNKIKWYETILNEAGLNSKENLIRKKKAEAVANARKEAEDIGGIL